MKKKIILMSLVVVMLIIALFILTGCANKGNKGEVESNVPSNLEQNTLEEKITTEENVEESKNEELENEEIENKLNGELKSKITSYGFDLEKMKPNIGGQEYLKKYEHETVYHGNQESIYYGESKAPTSAEKEAYNKKIFDYCKSIAADGKVYQSVNRFANPNTADVKKVNSVKEAVEISNTVTWSIKLKGYWYVISVLGDEYRLNTSIGVRIAQVTKY